MYIELKLSDDDNSKLRLIPVKSLSKLYYSKIRVCNRLNGRSVQEGEKQNYKNRRLYPSEPTKKYFSSHNDQSLYPFKTIESVDNISIMHCKNR